MWFYTEDNQRRLTLAQDVWRISPTTFYKNYSQLLLNLFGYSGTDGPYILKKGIDIFKINLVYHQEWSEPEYQYICKTFWIKLIQRTWKRKFAEKKRLQSMRGTLKNQRQFELTGKYGRGFNQINQYFPLFMTTSPSHPVKTAG